MNLARARDGSVKGEPPIMSDLQFEVLECGDLSAAQRTEILGLFEANYRSANPAFLEKSLARLRHVAIAYGNRGAAGFGIAESRVMDLPQWPGEVVMLAGLCCIAPSHRRQGLFRALENMAANAAPVPDVSRRLFCGRMAHPAALRSIASIGSVVPTPGVRPSPVQQETGKLIAEAYGVTEFDPETFVCMGNGDPIGYPKIELEVEPHEWEVFEAVDRSRGDALLALAWFPTDPSDW